MDRGAQQFSVGLLIYCIVSYNFVISPRKSNLRELDSSPDNSTYKSCASSLWNPRISTLKPAIL